MKRKEEETTEVGEKCFMRQKLNGTVHSANVLEGTLFREKKKKKISTILKKVSPVQNI